MKKNAIACILLFAFQVHSLKAQYYYYDDKYYGGNTVIEIGCSAGLMNCLTDLGGKTGTGKRFIGDLNMNVSKPCFSLYILATYKEALGLRLEGTFGSIGSCDSILKNVAPSTFGRYERNLSFKSVIMDIQFALEINPLYFKYYDENEAPFWSPYLVAGIGYFSFNPQARLNNQWYYLYPLHTEGQGFPEYPDRKMYKLGQLNIPLGMGLRYELNSLLNMRFEITHRILFTDYLDDVSTDYIDPLAFNNYLSPARANIARQLADRRISGPKGTQRGNPTGNDSFFTIQIKLGIALREKR